MKEAKRSIFRQEAVEKYLHEQENQVLPKFVSPRFFLCLWVMFGLLCGVGVWLCFAEVPIFASGQGIIIDQDKSPSCQGQTPCFAVFFPPHVRSDLIARKSLMIRHENGREWLDRPLIIVESKIMSPAEIKKSFVPKAGAIPLPTQPVAVAVCRLDPDTHSMPAELPVEGAFEVRIDTGTRPLASFLPLLQRFFRKSEQPKRKGT